ncbi:MAG: FAD-dependent oxidoreductase [Clostridiales bacterium]
MESIWRKTTTIPSHNNLEGDYETEVAVIGGGMAGILIAWLLRQQGKKVMVLEAARVGGGQSQNTTAKITLQHGLIYDRLITSFGEDKARQYAIANQKALVAYRSIIQNRNIRCCFEDRPAYLYATKDATPLKREAEAAQSLGIKASFQRQSDLPFSVAGAVEVAAQAQFHPLLFLQNLAADLPVYERTRVISVDENRINMDSGTITAQQIVFATHFPFINTPGFYFLRMHQERGYVVALENAAQLPGMYLGIDGDGLSFRNYGNLLLLGGGKHRTGENSSGGKYSMLEQKASELWPNCRKVAAWSAQDCISLDGVPYIGRFAAGKPNWYVATGFGKWGMTGSMVSAMLIRDMICGRENVDGEIFSPQRFTVPQSAKNLLMETSQAVQGLSRRFLEPPRDMAERLPRKHGGVVDYAGEKLGVYKDAWGELFVVDCRCPHLGCQLEWNPDELSWDCPCHGSRFDYRGHLLDNPAQLSLSEGCFPPGGSV